MTQEQWPRWLFFTEHATRWFQSHCRPGDIRVEVRLRFPVPEDLCSSRRLPTATVKR